MFNKKNQGENIPLTESTTEMEMEKLQDEGAKISRQNLTADLITLTSNSARNRIYDADISVLDSDVFKPYDGHDRV